MPRLRSPRCKTIESLNSYPAKAHHHAPKVMHNPRRITSSQQRMTSHTEKDPFLPEEMKPIILTGSFYKTQQTPVGDASRTKKTPRSAAYVQDDQSPTLAATTALRSRSVATRQISFQWFGSGVMVRSYDGTQRERPRGGGLDTSKHEPSWLHRAVADLSAIHPLRPG